MDRMSSAQGPVSEPVEPRIHAASTVMLVLAIALGWFVMSTIVATFGLTTTRTRFCEMLAAVEHPVLLVTGTYAGHGVATGVFSALCAMGIGGPVGSAPFPTTRGTACGSGAADLDAGVRPGSVLARSAAGVR